MIFLLGDDICSEGGLSQERSSFVVQCGTVSC
jgi:hypothetical protein